MVAIVKNISIRTNTKGRFMDIHKSKSIYRVLKFQKNMFDKLSVEEVAIVNNSDYIYSPVEVYPLAPKIVGPLSSLYAIIKDMDGTTTTTEPLCIYSLEQMLRKISGNIEKEQWKGLKKIDYPNIIGNSTTKHVEYLINKYNKMINNSRMIEAYFEALLRTLIFGRDMSREKEIKQNLLSLNLIEVLEDSIFNNILKDKQYKEENIYCYSHQLSEKYKEKCNLYSFDNQIRIAIDIYYAIYHNILSKIDRGKSEELINKSSEDKLIKPMPGVTALLLLTKGLLNIEDANYIYKHLIQELKEKNNVLPGEIISLEKFIELVNYFIRNPLKLAIVTSSIEYEANIVLKEVFRSIREQIDTWGIPEKLKEKYILAFNNYKNFYNAVVTASDSSEIRLKPHRDLYSIALHQLGIKKKDYSRCIGLEDSESGCISIRAAGIGLCVALPSTQSQGHNFSVASYTLQGGLPEFILKNKCMLKI